VPTLELSKLAGVLEYEPGEFTFTALAGTPVAEIERLLAAQGQYLPLDPLLVEHGATLGGTVAAGAAGPGRYRYGGVRDFLLGVEFVDGAGQLICGGGKVVKNAAGFDLPKLMVGSLGRLGVLLKLSFKVFPKPEAYATLRLEYTQLEKALEMLYHLATAKLELDALELERTADDDPFTLAVRLGGLAEALPARVARLQGLFGEAELLEGDEEVALWHQIREFAWSPPNAALLKIPLTPRHIPALEKQLSGQGTPRRYSVGGNVAWLATTKLDSLEQILAGQRLTGLLFFGPPGQPWFGARAEQPFATRVKQVLDPMARFLPL
jgi:glycolate oxidase FAD binding subunit